MDERRHRETHKGHGRSTSKTEDKMYKYTEAEARVRKKFEMVWISGFTLIFGRILMQFKTFITGTDSNPTKYANIYIIYI